MIKFKFLMSTVTLLLNENICLIYSTVPTFSELAITQSKFKGRAGGLGKVEELYSKVESTSRLLYKNWMCAYVCVEKKKSARWGFGGKGIDVRFRSPWVK